MRRYLLTVWVILGFTTAVCAQQKAPASSLLWEIRGNGLHAPSYLFGTFHLMCQQDFSISPVLQEKLTRSKQFFGELKMDDPMLAMSLATKMKLEQGSLRELIGETDYPAVADSFQQITGMNLLLLNSFQPFMSTSLLTLKSITCTDQVQPETELMKLAVSAKLPIGGLETVDDQVQAIMREPLQDQVNSFKKIVLGFDSVKHMMRKMQDIYQQKNTEQLYRFIKENGGTDDFEMNMLIKRNRNWIPVMEKAMKERPSFFAVGAGHLGGPQGVLALLKKKGYIVKPVLY